MILLFERHWEMIRANEYCEVNCLTLVLSILVCVCSTRKPENCYERMKRSRY